MARPNAPASRAACPSSWRSRCRWTSRWPITKKPGYDQLAAYFNLDNGSGKIRGINAEGLKRRGFDASRTSAIKRAYRALYVSGDSLADARVRLLGGVWDQELLDQLYTGVNPG